MRQALALALAVAAAAGLTAAPPSPPAGRAAVPVMLDVVVERPAGSPVLLQFLVAVRDPAEVRPAVDAALGVLDVHPTPSDARASWQPWGWAWDDDELPVPVAYNPTDAPPSVSPDALIAGLRAWSSVEGSRFAFRYAGITERVASILETGPDGENVVSWVHLPCDRGCVLGLTSKEATREVDMLLNSNPNALTELGLDTVLDWRTVILHELGHMASLGHSCPAPWGPCTPAELAAVMYFQYTGINRSLAPDDREGIRALYPAPPAPGTYRLTLEPGWNLLVPPPVSLPAAAALLPCLVAAYAYDGATWSRWFRDLSPAFSNLSTFAPGSVTWLFAHEACSTDIQTP